VGVLLSGTMNDGTAGFWEICRLGGVTIAQDPNEAEYPSMPQNAMQGAPVDYCLPLAEIAVKLKELVAGVATPPTSQTASVMIVEDEWLLVSELERQLTELGYTVVATVASGEQALGMASSAAPDIVLMDVGLAGRMKGTEAAVRLWEEFQIPIVFLTARVDQETARVGASLHAICISCEAPHCGAASLSHAVGAGKAPARDANNALGKDRLLNWLNV
jgi:chemotaxis response regulator CheB